VDSADTNASSRINVRARILKFQLRYIQPDPAAAPHYRAIVYVPAIDAGEGMVEVEEEEEATLIYIHIYDTTLVCTWRDSFMYMACGNMILHASLMYVKWLLIHTP